MTLAMMKGLMPRSSAMRVATVLVAGPAALRSEARVFVVYLYGIGHFLIPYLEGEAVEPDATFAGMSEMTEEQLRAWMTELHRQADAALSAASLTHGPETR